MFRTAAAWVCLAVCYGQGQTSSLAHYQLGEKYFQERNYQSAANEFREALNGDLEPLWIEVSSHSYLGRIFDQTGQHDRAENEYRLAQEADERAANAPNNVSDPAGVRVSSNGIVAPRIVQKTEAQYTDEARQAGLEGDVLFAGVITEDGSPRNMQILDPLGFGLDESALAAFKQLRFSPGTKQGQPVALFTTIAVEFRLPAIQSRWHLIGAEFRPPDGASRPTFLKTNYPLGAGISTNALEQGQVIRAGGRQGTATIAFEVDEHGSVANSQVLNASDPIWGREAVALIRDWQFHPGMKFGIPVSVPGTLEFLWGARNLDTPALEWARAQLDGTRSSPPLSRPAVDNVNQ